MTRLIQQATEKRLAKAHLHQRFVNEVQGNAAVMQCLNGCLADLEQNYLGGEHYPQKNERLSQLDLGQLERLIYRILFVVAENNTPSLSNVAGQCAGGVSAATMYYKLQTVGEVTAYMAKHGLVGLRMPQDAESGMLTVVRHFMPSPAFCQLAGQAMYLPPLVCEPNEVTHNRDSGWLCTEFGSLITKQGNHHDGDIGLDVINRKNRIPLKLNQEFLTKVDEVYSDKVAAEPEKLEQYQRFQAKSYEVFKYLLETGNRWHLLHKRDKRGRTYAQGYHASYQGNSFRKAMVEFADEEIVEGV